MRTLVVVFVVVALAGCVSHEPGDLDDAVPVPVYGTAEEVPCEYEALGIVSVVVPVTETADVRFVERVLGEVGARAGAHAVITLEPGDIILPFPADSLPRSVGSRGRSADLREIHETARVPLRGQAIRCIERN
jgi:hypothetical protein